MHAAAAAALFLIICAMTNSWSDYATLRREVMSTTTKQCSKCHRDLKKNQFSKNQWQSKKVRRCKTCIVAATASQASAAETQLPEDHPVQFRNPDTSTSMIMKDEIAYIGGRTTHLGHAAMPRNARPYSLDLSVARRQFDSRMGERQLMNIQAMSDAFNMQYNRRGVDPMTEAALSLETNVGLKYCNGRGRLQLGASEINECLIMSTHRWAVTVLPLAIIKEVSRMALMYREAVRTYKSMLEIQFPNTQRAFGGMRHVTDENRPEVIALMNFLLGQPFGLNIYVYSETDDKIYPVMREFIRSPKGLPNLSMDASSSDIMEYVHDQAGIMDPSCCFWCEKNKLSTEKLSVCTQCMAVSYCSAECQKRDWKSYHKEECAKLRGKGEGAKMTRDDVGLMVTRSATLRKPGVAKPWFPLEISPINNEDHVFRGDLLLGYVTHMDAETMAIDKKTKFFPLGLHIVSRELRQA